MTMLITPFGRLAVSGHRLLLAAALGLAAALLTILPISPAHALSEPTPAEESLTDIMGGANWSLDNKTKLKKLMNFNECLQFKMSASMHWCPTFFGPRPRPCLQLNYREPTAVTEATPDYKGKYVENGPALTQIIFGGPSKNPADKKAFRSIKTKHGNYNLSANSVRLYYPGPISRFMSSATPLQATQSLTCGTFGLGNLFQSFGNFVNMTFGQILNPANWGSMITSGLQGIGNAIAGGIQGLVTGIGNIAQSIANLPQMVAGQLQSLGEGLTATFGNLSQMANNGLNTLTSYGPPVGAQLEGFLNGSIPMNQLNVAQIAQVGGAMVMAGNALGELGAAGGNDEVLNTGIGLTGSGEAATTLAKGLEKGTLSEDEAVGLASSIYAGMQYAVGSEGTSVNVVSASTGNSNLSHPQTMQYGAAETEEEEELSFSAAVAAGQVSGNPLNPYMRWANVMLGDNGGKATGGLVPVAEMRNGPAQQDYIESVSLWNNVVIELGSIIAIGQYKSSRLNQATPQELCSAQYYSREDGAITAMLQAILIDTQSPTEFVPPATYLNGHQRQIAPADQPNASCPLTHAGFVPTGNGTQVNILNCHTYCWTVRRGPDDEVQACRIVPKRGYAGSCFTNPLSKDIVGPNGDLIFATIGGNTSTPPAGLYPACNGNTPTQVGDGRGGSITQAAGYNAALDHRTQLDRRFAQHYLTIISRAPVMLDAILAGLNAEISRRGGSCDELGNPTGAWAQNAEHQRPASNQYAQSQIPSAANAMASGAAGAGNLAETVNPIAPPAKIIGLCYNCTAEELAAWEARHKALEDYQDRMRKSISEDKLKEVKRLQQQWKNPIVKTTQKAARLARASGIMPQVLQEASTRDAPTEPAAKITAFIVQREVNLAMTVPTVPMPVSNPMCGIPGVPQSGLIPETPGMQAIMGDQLFIRCWGPRFPLTVFTAGGTDATQMALVSAKTQWASCTLGATQCQKNGKPEQISRDVPETHNTNDVKSAMFGPIGSGRAGRHKGTKCYDVGTGDPRFFNPGEGLLPVDLAGFVGDAFKNMNPLQAKALASPGQQVNTFWKDTQCCIPFSCKWNVRRDH